MEEALNDLEQMFVVACAQITAEYFQLPVADADAVYRERVYCYELYHRLRCLWNDFPFSLGGEIDKSGHPYFEDGPYAKAKPDFLVHQPGNMDANLACVEVKPFTGSVEGFAADLRKLTWFFQHANYHQGFFIVYGFDPDGDAGIPMLREKMHRAIRGAGDINPAVIRFLYHPGTGLESIRIGL